MTRARRHGRRVTFWASLEASGRLAQEGKSQPQFPRTLCSQGIAPSGLPYHPSLFGEQGARPRGQTGKRSSSWTCRDVWTEWWRGGVSWKRRRSSSVVSLRLTCVAPGAARGSRVRILELGKSRPEDNPRVRLLTLVAWAFQKL
jgi:hypothetical protein